MARFQEPVFWLNRFTNWTQKEEDGVAERKSSAELQIKISYHSNTKITKHDLEEMIVLFVCGTSNVTPLTRRTAHLATTRCVYAVSNGDREELRAAELKSQARWVTSRHGGAYTQRGRRTICPQSTDGQQGRKKCSGGCSADGCLFNLSNKCYIYPPPHCSTDA